VNGLVECKHFDVWESLMKACNNDHSKWVRVAPSMFWANHVTICQSTSYSPFFMAHSVEVVLLFDIAEATYLLPPLEAPALTKDLIAHCAQQLLKWLEDLHDMVDWVLKAHNLSAAQFMSHFSSTIIDYNLPVGSLMLIQNYHVKKELNCKTKACYLGPMVVIHLSKGGAYVLAEMNGTVSRLQYSSFHVVPYLPWSLENILLTSLLVAEDLEEVLVHSDDPLADDPEHLVDYLEGGWLISCLMLKKK